MMRGIYEGNQGIGVAVPISDIVLLENSVSKNRLQVNWVELKKITLLVWYNAT